MKKIEITKSYAMAEFEIIAYAAVGFFGIDKDYVVLEGVQTLPLGDNLEINEVYLPTSGKLGMINIRLVDADCNSLMPIKNLSVELIWDIITTIKQMILENS